MLVLIDTNVILDVLEKREAFYESSNHVLSLCASKKISGCIALHSISNIFYILRKIYSAENRRRLLLGILKFLRVADVSHENVRHALERNGFSDFEDCLQDECARMVNADCLVTCNLKDFKMAKTKVCSPDEFITLL